jgi:hypothetical protein
VRAKARASRAGGRRTRTLGQLLQAARVATDGEAARLGKAPLATALAALEGTDTVLYDQLVAQQLAEKLEVAKHSASLPLRLPPPPAGAEAEAAGLDASAVRAKKKASAGREPTMMPLMFITIMLPRSAVITPNWFVKTVACFQLEVVWHPFQLS